VDKVFLDLGGNLGQSVRRFYSEVPDAYTWRIYSFEPIEFDSLVAGTKKYSNVVCIKAVVGIKEGKTTIYPTGKLQRQGSTTEFGKTTGGVLYDNGLEVDEIDFVKWFKSFVRPGDFVIVKINIEGGEYRLMPYLPKILPQVSGLYIKLHHYKFKDLQKSRMIKIYNQFKEQAKQFNTFIYCDAAEGRDSDKGRYKFGWMLKEIEAGNHSVLELAV